MGAEQLYKAYRSSGLTLEEFEGPRYQRIGHIKKLLADGVLDANLRHVQPLRSDGCCARHAGEDLSAMSPGPLDASRFQTDLGEQLVTQNVGEEIFALAARIFPICRSITGDGVRQTLREIGSHVALEMHEVPTGTEVFDWTIPREWNIRDAYIKNGAGDKIVDFAQSNLHVMSYSVPVRKRAVAG